MTATRDPAAEPLLALLAGHHPTDDEEAKDLERIRRLIETTATPRSREQYEPGHLTASAIVVDPERSKTVLVFHQRLQRWLQPGGHVEPGELDPAETAAREVAEETGLLARWPTKTPLLLDVDVHLIPARTGEPGHCHFDLRYLLEAEGEPQAGDGVSEARWVETRELFELSIDHGLRRALGKVLS